MRKFLKFKKNKFGLIGLGGFIAERHLKVIKSLSQDLCICHDIIDSVGLIDRYFPNAKFELNYKNYLKNLKKERKISIEEVIVAEEKVVFKLPKELN